MLLFFLKMLFLWSLPVTCNKHYNKVDVCLCGFASTCLLHDKMLRYRDAPTSKSESCKPQLKLYLYLDLYYSDFFVFSCNFHSLSRPAKVRTHIWWKYKKSFIPLRTENYRAVVQWIWMWRFFNLCGSKWARPPETRFACVILCREPKT